jgi:hypothetical protein
VKNPNGVEHSYLPCQDGYIVLGVDRAYHGCALLDVSEDNGETRTARLSSLQVRALASQLTAIADQLDRVHHVPVPTAAVPR